MIRRTISTAMLGLMLSTALHAQDEAAKRQAAERAAQSWLALVDRGDYGQSWESAAAFFKSKITKADWESALKQVRAPLGAAGTRRLLGSMLQTDLPGAPPGQYVVIQYKTEFTGKTYMIETITPMLDHDGTWRISGYFVKAAQ